MSNYYYEYFKQHSHDRYATHKVGWSWGVWNEARETAGLDPIPLPVRPYPLKPLVKYSKRMGAFGKTRLLPGSILHRGFGDSQVISGLDYNSMTLTIDRITSFSQLFEESKGEFGPNVISIVLADPATSVFSDESRCISACCHGQACRAVPSKRHHFGDIGVEVSLMPGTYKIHSIDFVS